MARGDLRGAARSNRPAPAVPDPRACSSKRAPRSARSTSRSTTSSTRTIPTRTRSSIAGPTTCTSARAKASSSTFCCSIPAIGSSRACSTSRRARCARAASSPRRRSSPARTTPQPTASTSTCDVRDSWSLALDLKLEPHRRRDRMGHRALGRTTCSAPARRSRSATRAKSIATRRLLGYADGNVFGSRVRLRALLANASDGHRRELRRRAAVLLARHALVARRLDSRRAARRHDVRLGRGDRRVRPRHRRRHAARRLVARPRRAPRAALAVRRHVRGAHVSRRRRTSRSRCCCRRTASSSIRGSVGDGSRTTFAR